MTFLGVALSRMTLGVCKPPLADLGGREKREVFLCHHSMMQRPLIALFAPVGCRATIGRPGERQTDEYESNGVIKLLTSCRGISTFVGG